MTPRELNMHIEEHYRVKDEDQKFEMMLTYLGAKLPLLKEFPTFEKAFGVKLDFEKIEQTDEEMLAQIEKLNAALGGDTF
ncbi:MAG: hypothetical protein P0Y55_12050 [Candidatus Cohnella colombiensis]|uniref:Uncharacterized protein n=1 Tax=Candidatus Cohnella colombiensis TaxID=3121368 RepID=A0AA95JEJ6_9BACL|nr:MAG: hypothetical protein P0Y55_12050 [Cohnella sp.]